MSRCHGDLHELVGVEAAFHHGLGVAAAAHGDAELGGVGLGVGVEDGEGGDVEAHFAARALISASSPMRVGSMRPSAAASTAPRRATSERGQQTAVVMAGRDLQRSRNLMEDVIVGGMADEGVNGNGFGKGGKIAHGASCQHFYCGWRRRGILAFSFRPGGGGGPVFRVTDYGAWSCDVGGLAGWKGKKQKQKQKQKQVLRLRQAQVRACLRSDGMKGAYLPDTCSRHTEG